MKTKLARIAKRLPVLALIAVMLIVSAGIALGATRRVRATGEDRWRPRHQYISRGSYIRWINNTNAFHDVKSTNRGKNWSYHKNLPSNSSVRRKFRRAGNYHYRCTIHDGMTGWIHVSA